MNAALIKLGGLLLLIMVLLLALSPSYGFYVDFQANELVIITSGEAAQHVPEGVDRSRAHISLLDLAYGVVIGTTLLWLGLFVSLKQAGYLAGFLSLCTVLAYPFSLQQTTFSITMDSSIASKLNVYWADEAELYFERHSVSVPTQPGLHRYRLPIANLNNVHNLRIEPVKQPGKAAIVSMALEEDGYAPIVIDAKNYFYAVDRVKKSKITDTVLTEKLPLEQERLVYEAHNDETFFEVIIAPDGFKTGYTWGFYARLVLLWTGLFALFYSNCRVFSYFRQAVLPNTLRLGVALMLVMIVQMAWLSDYDAHPDEKAHIDSIDYYTHYSRPPVVGDVRALNTYQYPWGFSRLDDLGVSYIMMGKLKNRLTYFAEDTVFTCRVFNSLLILFLLWLTRNKQFALYILPILCLPQVWHLFAYANRDGFALWLAILLGWQWVNKDSYLQRYLHAKHWHIAWLIVPVMLLGLLSIELSNYAIFILFFMGLLAWQVLFISTERTVLLVRCAVFLLAASSLYGARKVVDITLNGFDKAAQKVAFAEAIAAPEFKPSVAVTEEGYFGLRLQQKGEPAWRLFTPKWDWQVLTFKSFAGLYGNEFAEYSPEWYYSYVRYVYVAIALLLLAAGLKAAALPMQCLTVLVVVFVFGDLLMGFLYSWLYDFQPQGRYIFPLIPMLMVFVYKVTPTLGYKTLIGLAVSAVFLYIFSLYSYYGVALHYLVY